MVLTRSLKLRYCDLKQSLKLSELDRRLKIYQKDMNLNFFRSKNVAIDLGNNNTVVSDNDRVLLAQPSYIVFDSESQAVKAV